jgi:hypothetical protein
MPRIKFPFDERLIPENGIYILFEKNESGHGKDRIVRIGTHTGRNKLLSRLKEHFVNENKDRSIFRKNIGRALLAKDKDPYLTSWELDILTIKGKKDNLYKINLEKQKEIEKRVTKCMRDNFSLVVFPVDEKNKRLELESKIISTISLCCECEPSKDWLGLFSPKEKIRKSGLWIVNELWKTPLSNKDIEELKTIINHAS